jgi:hypothetical protein
MFRRDQAEKPCAVCDLGDVLWRTAVTSTFRLHRDETHELENDVAPNPLRFERREVDRWPMESAATAFRVSGDGFGQMHDLRVLDYSDYGLGAVSHTVIEPGTIIAIGFQNPGYHAKRGTVLRCMPCGDGYRIAVQFQLRMAA